MSGMLSLQKPARRCDLLSVEEAEEIIRYIAMTAESEDEVKEMLNRSGFDGDAADIIDAGEAGYHLSVWGPYDEVIRV
jgi:hypothetical protein